ncbi:ornithine-acyl-ACP acyltransferase [Rhodobacterales bacterium 52_120_T64]|nr:ornithine-acyl-ACP acyltransferase [Rhodobacterales bacterium 52_120_T64]
MKIDTDRFEVRLARSDEDVAAAQRLRYKVFVKEMGAQASPEEHAARQERDEYDPYFEHLLLIDKQVEGDPLDKVCGVYRLMRGSVARAGIGFYGASEYDLTKLENLERETLELGRSCIAEEYRGGLGLRLIWDGLAQYVNKHDIGVLFGVASFHNADPAPIAEALSYLHHHHLAPPELCVKALPEHFAEMNRIPANQVDKRRALQNIPSLIKAYLRLGGHVGQGAFVDHDFNTVDVCLIMDTQNMTEKYRAFYERKRNA